MPYETLMNPGAKTAFFQKLFKDKILIVGDTTKLGNDWKDTPLGVIPGVEAHAYAESTLLRPEEKAALSVRKGSLTNEEFKQIQAHAQMSYGFLKQIDWTRDLENLAYIAWGHHKS